MVRTNLFLYEKPFRTVLGWRLLSRPLEFHILPAILGLSPSQGENGRRCGAQERVRFQRAF